MGYSKIIQFGDTTELYTYEKNFIYSPKRSLSKIQKRRIKERRQLSKNNPPSNRSIQRTRINFFRLVHHNVTIANTVDFLTLTFAYDLPYSQASRHVAHFFERLKNSDKSCLSVSFISVPERTKKGRLHFHLLLFNLPSVLSHNERETRFLQRQFRRGYLDIRSVTYRSAGLAGYMAKYLSKALSDRKNECKRGYNASRNIKKVSSYGSNSLHEYIDEFIDLSTLQKNDDYDTIFLGRCNYKKFKN